MAERVREKETYLELQEEDALSTEHLDSQVQKAQEQLLQLKRQQEQIEKQKRELEELSRRQELLQQGKTEMTEKLTRAMVVIERESHDAQKRVELLQTIYESYVQHLSAVETINPKNWENLDINKELNRALSTVDDARAEFARSSTKIKIEHGEETAAASSTVELYGGGYGGAPATGFVAWLVNGFAFTLPLLVFGTIVLVIFLLRTTTL